MRKRTGLRNRYRSSRSTYSKKNKHLTADRYGTYQQGRLQSAESLAGRSVSQQLASAKGDRGVFPSA